MIHAPFITFKTEQEAMGLRVEERIANAICKNPRIMKAGITLEFKEVITRVSRGMMSLNISTCNL